MTMERDGVFAGVVSCRLGASRSAASPLSDRRDGAPRGFGRGRPVPTGLRPGFAVLLSFMKGRPQPRESRSEHSLWPGLVQRPT